MVLHNPVASPNFKIDGKSAFLRVGLLLFIVWLAFGLRLIYVRRISPFVDEYISLLAMQSILERGVPVLPSGLFYGPKGVLHSYLGALSILLWGSSEFAARLLSVGAGVVAVCSVYRIGRAWFSPAVGVPAAMALAWLPAAVEWGGRARMYSLLQLLAVVGGYFLIDGYARSNQRWRIIGLIIMLLAVFTHTLALVVLGGLVAGIIVAWPLLSSNSRALLVPSFWELLVGAVFLLAVIILDPVSGPWGAGVRLSQVSRGVLSLANIQNRALYLLAFTHQFVVWPLWPLTIFYAIGFLNLLWRLKKKESLAGEGVALSLYITILCAWLATALLSALHEDRYLFAIIPFYLLLSFRELYLFTQTIWPSKKWTLKGRGIFTVATSLLVVTWFGPGVLHLVQEDSYGFKPAFMYVRDHWRNGDAVATCSPAPGHLFLNRTDYYLIQHGPESINGVDIWTGAPLVDTPEKFLQILDEPGRLWLVIEKLCWQRHFEADFQALVEQKMGVAFDHKGMLVFVSDSRR